MFHSLFQPCHTAILLADASYDYWATPSSDDLHPVGWCLTHHKELQKPKGHAGPFEWEAYLASLPAVAVPARLLTSSTNSTGSTTSKMVALRPLAVAVLELTGASSGACTPAHGAAARLQQLTVISPDAVEASPLPRTRSIAAERKGALKTVWHM